MYVSSFFLKPLKSEKIENLRFSRIFFGVSIYFDKFDFFTQECDCPDVHLVKFWCIFIEKRGRYEIKRENTPKFPEKWVFRG